jgi:hypothetical protein
MKKKKKRKKMYRKEYRTARLQKQQRHQTAGA